VNRIVVALGVSQIIGYGTLYYAFSTLVPHVAREFGTGEPLIYGVFSAGLLAGGLVAPVAGRAMDRVGAPWLMVWGSVLAGLVLGGMAAAPVVWLWLAGVAAIEVISVAVLYDAAFATLARLTGAEARRAITRLTLIAGFASTLFWPLTGWLSGALGWRGTYAVFATLHLTVALALHLWLWRQPVTAAEPVAGATPRPEVPPLPDRLRPLAFRSVAVSFALSGALIVALGVHMVPILAAAGLGAQAALVGMLMGPAQVAIRAVDAAMWRALHPLSVAMISGLALPLGVLALLAGLPPEVAGPVFAVMFGIGGGLSSIVRGSVPLTLFGPKGYGENLGRLALVRTFASAVAPVAFSASVLWLGQAGTLAGLAGLGVVAVWPIWRLRGRLRSEGVMGGMG
jgi:MFS family permease